jgi:hypothetical protein
MAVPAHGGQVLRIVIPTFGAGVDVMDLEPIAGMVPFDGATAVSGQDETSDLVGNGLRPAQVEELNLHLISRSLRPHRYTGSLRGLEVRPEARR